MMELEVKVLSAVRTAVSSLNTKDIHSALEALGESCPPPQQGDLYAQLKAQIEYQRELISAYREISGVLIKRGFLKYQTDGLDPASFQEFEEHLEKAKVSLEDDHNLDFHMQEAREAILRGLSGVNCLKNEGFIGIIDLYESLAKDLRKKLGETKEVKEDLQVKLEKIADRLKGLLELT